MQNILSIDTKIKAILFAILGISLMLIMSPKASAATYDISTSCTLNEAFEAINTQALVVDSDCPAGDSDGNTINIPEGEYELTANLLITNGANITMNGAGPSKTIISGMDNYGIDLQNPISGGYAFTGFTFRNAGQSAIRARFSAAGDIFLNELILRDNINCSTNACVLIENDSENDSSLVEFFVTKSSFINNTSKDSIIRIKSNGPSSTQTALVNNTISNNTGTAIAGTADGEEGIIGKVNLGLGYNTVANNTSSDPSSAGGFTYTGSRVEIFLINNILSGNGQNCQAGASAFSAGGNISSDNTCSGYLTAQKDKNGIDPQLLGLILDNGTYVAPLSATSPAVNNGIDPNLSEASSADDNIKALEVSLFATDQRGVARPQNGGFDSGSYELIAATPTPTPSNNATLASTGNDARIPLALAAVLVAIGAAGSVVALKRR